MTPHSGTTEYKRRRTPSTEDNDLVTMDDSKVDRPKGCGKEFNVYINEKEPYLLKRLQGIAICKSTYLCPECQRKQ